MSVATEEAGSMRFDVERVRADFPILKSRVRGHPLAYLDNAATTQKPQEVIDAQARFYAEENANIHRGVHQLSERATRAYEGARAKVQRFLNAADAREIVFVRGTTEAINLVAHSFVRPRLKPFDEILITAMEHHSNIVPWQMLCEQTGAVLKVAPITDAGEVVLDEYERLLGPSTRMVSVVHVSNTLGTVNPVRVMAQLARARGVPVMVDGAQAVAHLPVDVCSLGVDFYAFSGHKLFAPTGIGALYGRLELLEHMPPYQGGGDMIRSVSFQKTSYARPPARFEAGTPNIGGAVGLGAALDWLGRLDREAVAGWEGELLAHATARLAAIPGLTLVGTAAEKVGVVSFVLEGIHPHDVGTLLDQQGIAIRAGHHCTEPLMERLGLPATVRASVAFYNTREEIDRLAEGIRIVQEVLR